MAGIQDIDGFAIFEGKRHSLGLPTQFQRINRNKSKNLQSINDAVPIYNRQIKIRPNGRIFALAVNTVIRKLG